MFFNAVSFASFQQADEIIGRFIWLVFMLFSHFAANFSNRPWAASHSRNRAKG